MRHKSNEVPSRDFSSLPKLKESSSVVLSALQSAEKMEVASALLKQIQI